MRIKENKRQTGFDWQFKTCAVVWPLSCRHWRTMTSGSRVWVDWVQSCTAVAMASVSCLEEGSGNELSLLSSTKTGGNVAVLQRLSSRALVLEDLNGFDIQVQGREEFGFPVRFFLYPSNVNELTDRPWVKATGGTLLKKPQGSVLWFPPPS